MAELSDVALVTMEELNQYMNVLPAPENEVERVAIINQVTARFHQYTGRTSFKTKSYNHNGTVLPRLDSHGGQYLYLPNAPVTSVSASTLKTYPTHDALTEGYDEDYLVLHDEGVIQVFGGFLRGAQIVEVTYVAGYLTSPTTAQEALWGWDVAAADVKLAALQTCAWVLTQKERERDGVASVSQEGTNVTYLTDAYLPKVADVLDRYTRFLPSWQ